MAPEAKITTFKEMISRGSLKLKIMAEKTIASDCVNASHRWKDWLYKEHEDAMIKLLKDACSDIMPSQEPVCGS